MDRRDIKNALHALDSQDGGNREQVFETRTNIDSFADQNPGIVIFLALLFGNVGLAANFPVYYASVAGFVLVVGLLVWRASTQVRGRQISERSRVLYDAFSFLGDGSTVYKLRCFWNIISWLELGLFLPYLVGWYLCS